MARNVLIIFRIVELKFYIDIFYRFRDMTRFYVVFFDIFSRFVQFFSYIWRSNHNFKILTTSIEWSQKITSI